MYGNDLDRFILEGVTYYQQYRKCGKANCRVCREGPGHGPYWYSRDATSGRVRYIGKRLPENVTAAREAHGVLLHSMVEERHRLLVQFDALSRLIHNEPLTDEEREIVRVLGYGAVLV